MELNLNNKQCRGFVRAMSREILVHNPEYDVEAAIVLAEELLLRTWDYSPEAENENSHTHAESYGKLDDSQH